MHAGEKCLVRCLLKNTDFCFQDKSQALSRLRVLPKLCGLSLSPLQIGLSPTVWVILASFYGKPLLYCIERHVSVLSCVLVARGYRANPTHFHI